MAALLNSLPMSNKAWIGQRIETCIQQVREVGRSTCFMYKQLREDVAFVFAVFKNFNRTEKIRALNMLLPAVQYSSDLQEAFGIAYDADDEDVGFDVLWRRGPIQADDEVKQLAARFFSGTKETVCPTPFGEPRPYIPKD
jgi:hypothetical protein